MNAKLTHSPFFPTLARYARALRKDVSFTMSAKMLLRILLLAVGFFLLLGIAVREWADVYNATDKATQTWKEFLFGVLGAIDAKPEAGAGSVLYSAIVRLLGALLIGGAILPRPPAPRLATDASRRSTMHGRASGFMSIHFRTIWMNEGRNTRDRHGGKK